MRIPFVLAQMLLKEVFRKKDFYVALILMAVILAYASSLHFYNEKNVVRYLIEIGLMLIFLFSAILTVTLAARQYPSELQNRTLEVLLAKPITRRDLVIGKFVGSFLGGAACYFVFYTLFLAIVCKQLGGLFFPIATGTQTFYLYLLNLLVLAAMASAFSYWLTVSANVTLSLVLYLLIDTYGPALKEPAQVLYYCLPHFEFFDMRQRFIHGWGPVSPKLVLFLTAYAGLYTAFFLVLAWLGLRRRKI